MQNKTFWIVFMGVIITIISLAAAFSGIVPAFLAPFVTVILGVSIFYMTR